jgi:hypothetical protein
MEAPDQALFEEDIASVGFRDGARKGKWGLPPPDLLAEAFTWPKRLIWIGAAPRPNGPERFYISMNAAGYRSAPPTGTFWDPTTKSSLANPKRPKGTPGSRVERVFRIDWNNGTAFYHPYDRVAADSHKPQWATGATDDPRRRWSPEHTIVDYVEEFFGLLNCGDYIGV